MSSNIIGPFTKESDNPSGKVRETSRYLDDTKKELVFTNETVVKEGNNGMVDKKRKKT